MKKTPHKLLGFTLIEMMLVLVIMSTIVIMISNYTVLKTAQIRRDRAAIQMQQILNAALAYYINNSFWPGASTTSTTCTTPLTVLQNGFYLPTNMSPPYINESYIVSCNVSSGTFSVALTTGASTAQSINDARILAGIVPLGTSSGNTVTAQVNIPGQNLNNARSVNFVGLYHPGGCVPVPTCPTNMKPEIFVSGTQVMGTNDALSGSNPNVYPITNFYFYATAMSAAVSTGSTPSPPSCSTGATAACYGTDNKSSSTLSPSGSGLYWRVCADIGTEDGDIASTNTGSGSTSWAQFQTIMAVTRCSPSAETPGSTLNVWSP